MTELARELAQMKADLEGLGVRFALVGGLAVSARVEPRFTRDADLAVAVESDSDAEALLGALFGRGWRVVALVVHAARDRLATARLTRTDEDGVVLDLLFASTGIEADIVDEATALEVLSGLEIPVATVHHLAACKVLARSDDRPQDDVDLSQLLPRTDRASVQAALDLIVERGFHRGKDLTAQLDVVWQRYARR